jgi:hypothetical protein
MFASPRVRLQNLGVEGLADSSTAALRQAVKRASWLPHAARAPLSRGYQALGVALARGSQIAARARSAVADRSDNYACVIGVEPDGLELAQTIARGAPIGYFSLELLLSYELSTPADAQLKARERELSRQAAFVVIQDAERARLLVEDNALEPERVVLVPNSPPGPARRKPSRYWHERFGLPRHARVVLHSGSLGDWTGIESIVDSVPSWPEPWLLVVHTRYDAESSAYVAKLRRRADPRRVHFSLKPVARQHYDALIDGADVGVAFYVATRESSITQTNVQAVGLSSGKLAYYLRAGLPVIVNAAASVAATLTARGCGVAVDHAHEIPGALQQLDERYAAFSSSACAFFDDQLDSRRAFDEVLARVDALQGVA